MARYRKVSSPVGSYYDRITDQVQVTLWFGAAGFAAFAQTNSVTPVFLSLLGIAFYGLRGYAKYVALEIETGRNPDYPAQIAQMKQVQTTAGLGFGLKANLTWFGREQSKFSPLMKACSSSCSLRHSSLTNSYPCFGCLRKPSVLGPLQIMVRGKNIDKNLKGSNAKIACFIRLI